MWGSHPVSLPSTIHAILWKLRTQLSAAHSKVHSAFRGLWKRDRFGVAFGGWRWSCQSPEAKKELAREVSLIHSLEGPFSYYRPMAVGMRVTPLVGTIEKKPGTHEFDLQLGSRSWHLKPQMLTQQLPDCFLSKEVADKLRLALAASRSPWESMDACICAIQDVSKGGAPVGSDCMSVVIDPPTYGIIFIVYTPAQAEWGVFGSPSASERIQIGYSPWIVTKTAMLAPSIIAGAGMRVQCGLYQVRMPAPVPPDSGGRMRLSGVASSQDRKNQFVRGGLSRPPQDKKGPRLQ
jgi:hypothetical protein